VVIGVVLTVMIMNALFVLLKSLGIVLMRILVLVLAMNGVMLMLQLVQKSRVTMVGVRMIHAWAAGVSVIMVRIV